MSNFDNKCKSLNKTIDGIVSVSLINLKDGSVISISGSENNNSDLKSNLSSIAMSIFKNPNIEKIEKSFSQIENKESKDPFKEIFISSNTNFYFMRLLEKLEYALFIISKKTVNQGIIWLEIKKSATEIENS